jgi:hypothetical protein
MDDPLPVRRLAGDDADVVRIPQPRQFRGRRRWSLPSPIRAQARDGGRTCRDTHSDRCRTRRAHSDDMRVGVDRRTFDQSCAADAVLQPRGRNGLRCVVNPRASAGTKRPCCSA